MIKAKYSCRNRDFESRAVKTQAENLLESAEVELHLSKNPDHVIELVFVWETS